MKRLFVITLLILTFNANALAGVMAFACTNQLYPVKIEMGNNQHSGHSQDMAIDKAQGLAGHCVASVCDSVSNHHDCGNCQHHQCGSSALLPQYLVMAGISPTINHPFYLLASLPARAQRLLRPPRFS